MSKKIKIVVSLLFSLVLFVNFTYSFDKQGTTGKITGKVVDAKDNSALIGATIKIEGTNLGAISDDAGEYTILNVDVGTYVVKGSYIGYDPQSVSDVKVSADLTTQVNFALSVKGQIVTPDIEIVGKRNAISPDQSGTIISKDYIDNSGVRGIENLAAKTAGVVQDEKGVEINIRGGRSDETSVIIDGVLTTNPLNGTSTAFVGNGSLEELAVLTGGFSAEYGNALSGIINVSTLSGTDKYSGSFEAITDEFTGAWLSTTSQGYNVYNINIGGPVIPSKKLANFMNFFGGVERDFSLVSNPAWVANDLPLFDNVLPGFSLQRWSGNGKLNFDISTLNPKIPIQVKLGTNISNTDARQFVGSYWMYNWQNNPQLVDDNYQYYGKVNHQISSKFFYEAQFNYFLVESISQNPFFTDNLFEYGSRSNGNNIGFDAYNQFALQGRVFNLFQSSSTEYWEANLSSTAQVSNNELKFGGSYRYHTIRYYSVSPVRAYNYRNIQDPDSLQNIFDNNLAANYYGYNYDYTQEVDGGADGAKNPIIASIYALDKIEFKDFTLNAGLRWDFLDANSWTVKDLSHIVKYGDPLVLDEPDFSDASDPTSYLSPRLGFSFPVTNNTIFHAQYGKFIQMPNLENLYIGRQNLTFWVNTSGFAGSFGNPNLQPEKTTAYEIGVKQQVGDRLSVDITAYYKETEDLIGIQKYPQLPNQLQVYENKDYGTLRGFDLSLDLRRTNRLAFNMAYGLAWASGTGSNPESATTAAWLGTQQPKLTSPLDYDQRHTGVINVDYRFGKTDVPKGFWGGVLSQLGVNLLYQYNSGRPYTIKDPGTDPFSSTGGGATLKSPINGAYMPWNNKFDMKIDKTVSVSSLDFNIYIYVLNLLNSQLINDVWAGSGDPGVTGFLSTPQGEQTILSYNNPSQGTTSEEYVYLYSLRSANVLNYGPPRQIRFGIKMNF